MSVESDLDIAVIGVSCQFGGAGNIEQYWQAIVEQRSLIRTLDAAAMRARGAEGQVGQAGMVHRMAAVPDMAAFDHQRFGITRADAEIADPQLRMLFTHSALALASAGVNPARYDGRIGVFGSVSTSAEWAQHVRASLGGTHALHEMSLVDRDFYITRLAYGLGLTGPAILLNTACSSSLVALHAAIQSLLAGDCDIALAGACSLRPFWGGYLAQDGGIFSPTGACAPFSADADGTVPGEGAAFLVLKPLSAAREAGERIFCVVKGSAVNNDGRDKPGYAAPAAQGQGAVIQAALAAAGIEPAALAYVECHGTGTKLGDPVEVSALDRALRQWGKREPVHIGSVKATIGHTDVAAGIAGLIKAALILRHRSIPPQVGIGELNPLCRFPDTLFKLAQETATLDARQSWCAGISSFGVGGTNAHAVIAAGDTDFPLSVAQEQPGAAARFDKLILQHNPGTAASQPDADPHIMAAVLDILRENALATGIGPQSRLQDLGIDSISVVMITEELQARFGSAPSTARFVELATVADLVEAVRLDGTPTPVEAIPDTSPLTFGQQRFFYPQPANPLTEGYAALLRLAPGVTVQRVKAAVATTILHHQALRSRFLRDGEGRWFVRYEDYPADGYFSVVARERSADFDAKAYCRDVLGALDFTRAPLFSAHLIRFTDGPQQLILFTHHVIYDGYSINIIFQDLLAQFQPGAPGLPAATPVSLYAAAQRSWYGELDREAQRAYWSRPEWQACRPLPVDAAAGVGGRTGDEIEHRHVLDAAASAALVEGLKRHKVGMLDLIVHAVSSFYLAESGGEWLQMSCAFGGRSDVIGAQGHDFSRTVGLLALNGLLLIRQPHGGSALEQVMDIKRQLAGIPERGLAYFIDPSGLPAYDRQIGVNFLGYDSFTTAGPASHEIGLVREFQFMPPDLERWYRLDFDFGFENGCFFVGCRYSCRQYRADTIAGYVGGIAGKLLFQGMMDGELLE